MELYILRDYKSDMFGRLFGSEHVFLFGFPNNLSEQSSDLAVLTFLKHAIGVCEFFVLLSNNVFNRVIVIIL